jgi:serine/threonine protein kinase
MLNELRELKHPHIIKLLASFEQDKDYCMLFPLANCNLEEYMRRNPPTLKKEFIVWLLKQLRGLAHALCKIHNSKPDEPSTHGIISPSASLQQHKTGYHHDLKPQNILFFDKTDIIAEETDTTVDEYGIFQISDFGVGRFHQLKAGTGTTTGTRGKWGTPAYAAPEFAKGAPLSRPYDMWSLGCIFLELLVWIIFSNEGWSDFKDDRLSDYADDAFYIEQDGAFIVRPQVKKWIRLLKERCPPALARTLGAVENGLLVPDPWNRWKSNKLFGYLDRIVLQITNETEDFLELADADTSESSNGHLRNVPTIITPPHLSTSSITKQELPCKPYQSFRSFPWSDRGRDVEYASESEVPLTYISNLGHSTYGVVDKVTCRGLVFARKRVKFKGEAELEKILNEVKVLQRLQHPHIIQLVGTYRHNLALGIIHHPAAECDLASFLSTVASHNTLEQYQKLRAFFGCLSRALEFLHRESVKHKDIKPQNILVDGYSVYLADFGLSCYFGDTGQSQSKGSTSHTPLYCAPEVAESKPRGTRADIFSLGCVFLEMISVIGGETIESLRELFTDANGSKAYHKNTDKIPTWVNRLKGKLDSRVVELLPVINRMMNSEPGERPDAKKLFDIFEGISDFICPTCHLDGRDFHRYHPVEGRTMPRVIVIPVED